MLQQPPIFLKASDPKQVSSAKTLEVLTGTPTRRMFIFTGIAFPSNVESRGRVDGYEVTVDLGMRSNVKQPQYTATVALAGVSSADVDDSDFVFSTNDVTVIADEPNWDLKLICNLSVLGTNRTTCTLQAFSYQATVFLDPDEAQIAGTIRWDPRLMTHDATKETHLFDIKAVTHETKINEGSPFTQSVTVEQKTGVELSRPAREGSLLAVNYIVHEPPLNTALFIEVTPRAGAFVATDPQPNTRAVFLQVSGPSPIILRPVHLREFPVDFLGGITPGVR